MHFTYCVRHSIIEGMKKRLSTIFILILIVLAPVLADSSTKFGMNVGYSNITGKPEMGMYMTTAFVDSRNPNPVHLGFGMRIDMDTTIPIERMDVGFITGLAIDFKLKNNWGIDMVIGPAFAVSTPFSSQPDEGMAVGGGAEISATYFLDSNRTSGISMGLTASGGMYIPDSQTDAASPYGKVAGFFGFTFRTNTHSMFYGANDIYITL